MYLVTVTCKRDFNQMMLQAESISKFLKPGCHHYVIINDYNADLAFWHNHLDPYYSNHTLHIIPRIHYDYLKCGIYLEDNSTTGWRVQQLQKLLIAYLINDDYVILDSKDFFIRDTDINEWNTSIGSTVSKENEHNIYDSAAKIYADHFNIERSMIFHPYTPYVIRKKYITENKNFDFFTMGEILCAPMIHKENFSEFVFYSYLIPADHDVWFKNLGPNPKPIKFFSIKDYEGSSSQFFIDFYNTCKNTNVKIIGIHQRLLSEIDEKVLDSVNNLLYTNYGLTTKLLPVPTEKSI